MGSVVGVQYLFLMKQFRIDTPSKKSNCVCISSSTKERMESIKIEQMQAQFAEANAAVLRGMQRRQQGPPRVQRSADQKLIWIVVTAVTNFLFIPCTFHSDVLLKKHLVFETVLSAFTLMASFLYHFCESMDYYPDRGGRSTFSDGAWLGKGRWHRLDNVGAILCFVVLLIQ